MEINHDEIKTFLDARYVSAPEALWRIFKFPMHKNSHVIHRLPVHLPQCQYVYFNEEQLVNEDSLTNKSELLAWFALNAKDASSSRQYYYTEIPNHYVYNKSTGKWNPRKRGGDMVISRMASAKPSQGERFFLRLLLLHTPGAKSYSDLRTVDDITYDTFREACSALGLLSDDTEWYNSMLEASTFQMPSQLRQLFATILVYCDPSDPLSIWNEFKTSMIEDFVYMSMSTDDAENKALCKINSVLQQHGRCLLDFNLPEAEHDGLEDDDIPVSLPADSLIAIREKMNCEQDHFADSVISSIESLRNGQHPPTNYFYLDAPGGTGKTFTFNYLIAFLRNNGYQVATAAPTGVAANLLLGGRTLHKTFRLPVPIVENSTCKISPISKQGEALRNIDIFFIDEASAISRYALEAIDRLMRDITDCHLPFGGKIVVMGGDFRQTLPVIRHARPAQIIEACLKSSPLWHHFTKFSLTENMRAAPGELEFANWLLTIGNNEAQTKQDMPYYGAIEIPNSCVIQHDASMVDLMYDTNDISEFSSRVIVAPTNDDSLKLNDMVLQKLPGEETTYLSSDTILADDEEERALYPIEFINTQTPSGMPPHSLKLKEGAVVMLMRNLDVDKGLCNGTRLVITALGRNVITCRHLTNNPIPVLIPRIQLAPSETGLPFQLCRRQFPLRLAYSMTIDKSQGQTFSKIGIFLRKPCFSHGQLYVAFSRAKRFSDILVQIMETSQQGEIQNHFFTPNVVYPQVLN